MARRHGPGRVLSLVTAQCGMKGCRIDRREEPRRSVSFARFNVLCCAGAGLRRSAVLTLDGIVDFLPVYRYGLGCLDTQADFVTTDIHDRHDDVVADHDAFVSVSGKDEHYVLVGSAGRCWFRYHPHCNG